MLLGARYEYGLPVIKSDISTGLRFVGINSEITGYASANSDFFYLRYSMEETDTKFARVKSLTECNYILSIPLAVSYTHLDVYKRQQEVSHSVNFIIRYKGD